MKAPKNTTLSVRGALAVAGIWLAIAAVAVSCIVWGPTTLLVLFGGFLIALIGVGLVAGSRALYDAIVALYDAIAEAEANAAEEKRRRARDSE